MITVEASTLAAAMAHASAIPAAKNTIPIMSHARLIVRDGQLEITTSDLDIQFQTAIHLAKAGELAVCVDAGRLHDLAKTAAPGAQISMNVDGRHLVVKSGRSRWKLNFLPTTDFPDKAKAIEDSVGIDVSGAALSSALSRTIWAVSTEETRYYLNGIFMNGLTGTLTMVATDGHRAIELQTDFPWPDDAPQVIVPTKLVNLICRLIGKGAEDVHMRWSDRAMQLTIGNATLLGKMIDGQFPDYTRVIPPESHATLIDPESVRQALRRVLLVAEGKTRIIKMERSASKLTLSSTSSEHGEAYEEIPAEVEATAYGATGFNAAYLATALEHLGGDTVRINQQDAGSPALFRRHPADKARVVIMPCRV